ncbi:hypothetical protein [Streptomyces sp. NPDC003710]
MAAAGTLVATGLLAWLAVALLTSTRTPKVASDAANDAQHIQVPKSSTAESLPDVNSRAQRKCRLIISVGPDLHDAVTTAARHTPHQRFINIGRGEPGAGRAAVPAAPAPEPSHAISWLPTTRAVLAGQRCGE